MQSTTTAATTQDEQQLPIPQKPDTEAYNANLEFETVWATIQRLNARITELEKRVSRIEEK